MIDTLIIIGIIVGSWVLFFWIASKPWGLLTMVCLANPLTALVWAIVGLKLLNEKLEEDKQNE